MKEYFNTEKIKEFGMTSDFLMQSSSEQITLDFSGSSNGTYGNTTAYDETYNIQKVGIFDDPYNVLHLIVCIVGLLANTLSVVATAHIPHGLTAHSKLIISLAFSDGLILVSRLLIFLFYMMTSWKFCFYTVQRVLLDTGVFATLLNLLAMALDHFLAIMKPMSYRKFMKSLRCNCMIVAIWCLSLVVGLLEVFVGLAVDFGFQLPFCRRLVMDDFNTKMIVIALIFIVLIGVIILYTRIYFVAKYIIARDNMMYQDEMHNYKAIVTTMLIIGTFSLFWTPLAFFKIYVHFHEEDFAVLIDADNIVFLVFLLNSLADPFIYATRLHEVRRGYKALFLKIFPKFRYSTNENEYRHHNAIYFSKRRDTVNTLVNGVTNCSSPDSNCPDVKTEFEKTSLMPIKSCENE